jgi:hypothetical protein
MQYPSSGIRQEKRPMSGFHPAEDADSDLLERRWFAATRAASETQSECDALTRVLELTSAALRDARARCAHLEQLRDALGGEVAEIYHRALSRSLPFARESAA